MHLQTDSQTEVINITLGNLLRILVKKNKRSWEECLPIAEFAYNRTSHSTTSYSPFFVAYGFNPLTPLNLSALPVNETLDLDGETKAQKIKELHEKVKQRIEKIHEHNAKIVNNNRKELVFQPGDYVWVHFQKLSFPKKRDSKLEPRGDGPAECASCLNVHIFNG